VYLKIKVGVFKGLESWCTPQPQQLREWLRNCGGDCPLHSL